MSKRPAQLLENAVGLVESKFGKENILRLSVTYLDYQDVLSGILPEDGLDEHFQKLIHGLDDEPPEFLYEVRTDVRLGNEELGLAYFFVRGEEEQSTMVMAALRSHKLWTAGSVWVLEELKEEIPEELEDLFASAPTFMVPDSDLYQMLEAAAERDPEAAKDLEAWKVKASRSFERKLGLQRVGNGRTLHTEEEMAQNEQRYPSEADLETKIGAVMEQVLLEAAEAGQLSLGDGDVMDIDTLKEIVDDFQKPAPDEDS